jgi:hypothetical protein
MLAGYIFCADCGAAMTFNNRDFGNGRRGEFVCGSLKSGQTARMIRQVYRRTGSGLKTCKR